MGISVWQLLILAVLFSLVFLPFLLTLFSKKVRGEMKLGWALLVLFTSWLGYAAFLLLAPSVKEAHNRHIEH
ncbi:hypothetical protein CWC33_04555 [Idiomarina sp. X4]|nr:hypothetical protein CWC33_04555 [Idiomarina sp. X4]RXS43316.1 hypothetical protein EST55_06155 [Idiomarina sp. 29L]